MKSKIEKIESVYDLYDGDRNIDANKLKDILNNIIEAHNSQSQPEEKPIYVAFMGEEIVAGTNESIEKYRKDTEDFLKGKDTPEEWEKEFKFLYGHLYIQNEDGEFCKISGEVEDMIDFIKQLLEDREREVLQEIIGMVKTMAKDYYSGNTQLYLDVRNVQDKLDKLNNKKK